MDWIKIKEDIDKRANNGQLHTVAALAFLMAIVLFNQVSHFLITSIYYLCALFAFAVYLYGDGKQIKIPKQIGIFAMLILLTGLINVIYPGNSTINKQLFTFISVSIALIFLDKRIDERIFLVMLLVNVLVVLIRILVGGVEGQIYVSSSANYVSVHLLCPLVLLYSERERRRKKLILWPALLTWIVCLIARGRGGILFSSFLLFGLVFVRFFPAFLKLDKHKKQIICGVLAGILLLAVILLWGFGLINKIPVLAKFAQLGLSSNGRGPIWGDYLRQSFATFRDLLLAPDLNAIQRVINHGGNAHNSFINIHAYNGLIMFIVVIVMCVNATIIGIRRGKWVYLICFATFCMRGFTDYVFWGSTGTPFLFYFMFMPYVVRKHNPVWIIEFEKVIAFIGNKKTQIATMLRERKAKKQSVQKEDKE